MTRDWFWNKLGLFALKKSIKRKWYFTKAAKEDEARRRMIAEKIMQLPDKMISPIEGTNLIVSMTSYGYRLEKTCPYALYSIFQQTQLPNRIVLNINQNKWNDDNIPDLLKKLQRVGVEINYAEDIGPHTKFIPTLKKYPNDIIITADDDILYDSTLVGELMAAYEASDRKSVVCREATRAVDNNGKFVAYSKQKQLDHQCYDTNLIPLGFAGVLYPPHIFSNEIFNTKLIQKLCPKADDIWFGVMEILSRIKILCVIPNSFREVNVDYNEEFNPRISGALHFSNNENGQNDMQWEAMVAHYKLTEEV